MPRRTLALSCAGLILLAGCSAPAPAPAQDAAPATAAGAAAEAPASAAPAPAGAPDVDLPGSTAGEQVDAAAFLAALGEGQKGVRTYREVSTSTITMGDSKSTSVTTTEVDQSDPQHYKARSVVDDPAMETVMDGSAMYTRKGGGEWTKTDVGGSLDQMQDGMGQFTEAMKQAMKVTYVGEETVEEIATRRYDVAIDLGGGLPAVSNTYWLTDAGWPVKTATTSPASTTETIRSNVDQPVTIEVPKV